MRELLGEPFYRAHLVERRMHQMVMIGYSDSNKDAGSGVALGASSGASGARRGDGPLRVDLTFFHGRGSVSRGGGRIAMHPERSRRSVRAATA